MPDDRTDHRHVWTHNDSSDVHDLTQNETLPVSRRGKPFEVAVGRGNKCSRSDFKLNLILPKGKWTNVDGWTDIAGKRVESRYVKGQLSTKSGIDKLAKPIITVQVGAGGNSGIAMSGSVGDDEFINTIEQSLLSKIDLPGYGRRVESPVITGEFKTEIGSRIGVNAVSRFDTASECFFGEQSIDVRHWHSKSDEEENQKGGELLHVRPCLAGATELEKSSNVIDSVTVSSSCL